MKKVAIIYYSRGGNTKKMAELVLEGVSSVVGVDAEMLDVTETDVAKLPGYDGLIVGSPTYYGTMAWEIKRLFDESVKYHGKFDGKIGAAFTSAANIGGGNETTIMDILKVMLVHGMIVRGTPKGDHYGPVAIGSPDDRACEQSRELGIRIAELVNKAG
ncbi:MAG: flavodoxin family protein [Candidatus Omnitrophica bacterium]|nr:flavodoxin family protein [Candidatus Omnitrophota bacterium]